ncbi:MAG: ribbon-helix-helix domain-containing protein [Candidatus Asgardarchaeum sp.]
MKEEKVVISSIRISKLLAKKLELIAKKKGFTSKSELIKRALEEFAERHLADKPRSAEDILQLVEKRSGTVAKMKKKPSEIFMEEYLLEESG